jgi:hypothetical protein
LDKANGQACREIFTSVTVPIETHKTPAAGTEESCLRFAPIRRIIL